MPIVGITAVYVDLDAEMYIRTMSGREEELIDEMKRYGLEVLGASKARMRENGVKMIGEVTLCIWVCKLVEPKQV